MQYRQWLSRRHIGW